MALLGNYNIFNKNVIQYTGGDSLSGIVGLRYNWNRSGTGRFYGETWIVGVADRCGVPNGYSAPYSYKLPPKTGGLGSNVGVRGLGAFTGSGALGRNIEATIEGLGEISNANLGLILSAVATLSGIGGLSADVLGALQASATLAGQGDMSGSLGALAGAVATLSGSGTMDNDITAKASLSADIYVNQSEASVQQIVSGVWNALAINYNTSGTMGEASQTAGASGGATAAQVWAYSDRTLTESAGLTAEQAIQLDEIHTNADGKISEIRTGGAGINIEGIRGTINNAKNEIKEHIDEKMKEIPTPDLSSIESSIGIAKEEIIDTIKSTEDEVCRDIVRAKKENKEENVSTRNLIREKTKKLGENVSKLADRQRMVDEAIESESEEIEDEIERILQEESDMIESEIETQLNNEADDIELELNNQQNGNS